jgi:diacylglycerol kinase (ATP)
MGTFVMRLLQSFRYALRGVVLLICTEANARVHLAATLLVCALGTYFGLSRTEWLWVVIAIAAVWSAEALNSALEALADTLHPARHPGIGRAKDLAAAAVLIAAVAAAVIGGLVLGPHLVAAAR